MTTVTVSSKGQIVLPSALRRKLRLGAGTTLDIVEEDGGLKLHVLRSVSPTDVAVLAGMVVASTRGVPRKLADFDPASLLVRKRAPMP